MLFSLAENMDTRRKYAIKREPLKMRRPQIKHENDIYNVLAGCRKFFYFYFYFYNALLLT